MTGKKKTGFMLAMLIVMAMGAGCSGNKVTDNGDSKTEAPTTSFEASTENEKEETDDADEEEKYDTYNKRYFVFYEGCCWKISY